jgi:hypothetical protein
MNEKQGLDNSKSRCINTGTLYQELCDRYGVSYYTDNEELLKLVKAELE